MYQEKKLSWNWTQNTIFVKNPFDNLWYNKRRFYSTFIDGSIIKCSNIKKMSPEIVKDLNILIKHALLDIEYGDGGSFTLEGLNEVDFKDIRSATRAIDYIKSLIINNK